MLERYGHGGDLTTAEAEFGMPEGGFLDYSSNMNPFGPPNIVGDIVRSQWRELARYPDPAVRELRNKLAIKFDIEPDSILAGNGAAELIDLAIRVLQPSVTGIARPSFTEYEEAVRKTEGKLIHIPLHSECGFIPQEKDIRNAAERSKLLVLGHPNNPTGQLLNPELMRTIVSEGTPLLIDEAFIDFVLEMQNVSLLKLASTTPHLHVLRSMTKFYAIPGIRLGFVVSHPDSIRKLRERQVPWSVNSFAQKIGTAVLEDIQYEQKTHSWLATEKPWLAARLTEIGMRVFEGSVNYLLFSLPQGKWPIRVQEVQRRLGHRGILIRDASLFEGLDHRYARVAVRFREDNERLIRELNQVVKALENEAGGEEVV